MFRGDHAARWDSQQWAHAATLEAPRATFFPLRPEASSRSRRVWQPELLFLDGF